VKNTFLTCGYGYENQMHCIFEFYVIKFFFISKLLSSEAQTHRKSKQLLSNLFGKFR